MGQFSGKSIHLPLTAAQYEIWIAQELSPQSADYRAGEYLEIFGPVDSDLMESATRQVVLEAESIRARFVEADGNVYQYIEELSEWTFHVFDLADSSDPDAEALKWISSEINSPMRLECGPLLPLRCSNCRPIGICGITAIITS
nr:condensation domain-containing protein [Rhodococcus sp. MTM3W5.2]